MNAKTKKCGGSTGPKAKNGRDSISACKGIHIGDQKMRTNHQASNRTKTGRDTSGAATAPDEGSPTARTSFSYSVTGVPSSERLTAVKASVKSSHLRRAAKIARRVQNINLFTGRAGRSQCRLAAAAGLLTLRVDGPKMSMQQVLTPGDGATVHDSGSVPASPDTLVRLAMSEVPNSTVEIDIDGNRDENADISLVDLAYAQAGHQRVLTHRCVCERAPCLGSVPCLVVATNMLKVAVREAAVGAERKKWPDDILSHIAVVPVGKRLAFVGTDTHRLTVAYAEAEVMPPRMLLAPARALQAAVDALGKGTMACIHQCGEGKGVSIWDLRALVDLVVDSDLRDVWPDIGRFLKTRMSPLLTVARDEALAQSLAARSRGIEEAWLVSDSEGDRIEWRPHVGKTLEVRARCASRAPRSVFPVCLCSKYLSDALKRLKGRTVRLSVSKKRIVVVRVESDATPAVAHYIQAFEQ
jgi:hypothetical protein